MDSYVKKRSSVSQSLKQPIRRNCKTMGLSLSMFQDAHIFFHLEWLRSMTDKSSLFDDVYNEATVSRR